MRRRRWNADNLYLCKVILPIDDFLKARHSLPVVDVRSEKEYHQGHIRGAVNLPILNNEERSIVGTVYKHQGQKEAITTGFRLVGPRFADIIEQADDIAGGRELLVHCWRGGMRSANFCQIIAMARIAAHQLQGGYKAYRERALTTYRQNFDLRVIGGYTGSGKSEIIRSLKDRGEQVIDLEALAHHKGSAFGGLTMPSQPTTEQFQNELFEELAKLDLSRPVWVEDESVSIGKVVLPQPFWRQISTATLYEVVMDKTTRIERLVREYGCADRKAFLEAMTRITRKLGGQNFNAARKKLLEGDMAGTIEILLEYYDKVYERALARKRDRLQARVSWDGGDALSCADELIGTLQTQAWTK